MAGYLRTFVLPKAHPKTLIKNELMASRPKGLSRRGCSTHRYSEPKLRVPISSLLNLKIFLPLKGFKVAIESI